jgi:uncharacterized protein YndB with AHSA1/START domain
MQDLIETSILLPAAPQRVWQAVSDYREFGEWFRARLEGPFVPGQLLRGQVSYPGCEQLWFEAWVVAIEAPRRLAFRWHPYAVDPALDYAAEPTTLVEFFIEPEGAGTLLAVRESGFTLLPEGRQALALRMNEEGWRIQALNLDTYLAAELP